MAKKNAPLDLGLTRLPVILPISPRGTSDHVWGETALKSLGWCITRQHGVRHHQHHLPHDHDHHDHHVHQQHQTMCGGKLLWRIWSRRRGIQSTNLVIINIHIIVGILTPCCWVNTPTPSLACSAMPNHRRHCH